MPCLYGKIRTRKQSAKKRIKTGKKMESTSFWNPESTVLESGIHSMASRIQDCPGFPYMGRCQGNTLAEMCKFSSTISRLKEQI